MRMSCTHRPRHASEDWDDPAKSNWQVAVPLGDLDQHIEDTEDDDLRDVLVEARKRLPALIERLAKKGIEVTGGA